MQTIVIAGVGLIGGSLGLALRKAGFKGRILGISSPATIDKAIERGAIDEGVSLTEAAQAADVFYLAQPISVILDTIDRIASLVRPECLVTDAGSTKARIVEHAAKLPLFLGGHPMAGKEARGIAAADPDLFADRPYILTPPEGRLMESPAVSDFVQWLRRCGTVPVLLSPSKHDFTVSWTSHLPQLASTALARSLSGQLTLDQIVSASGPGLKDATRLALSPWSVWRDIVQTNTEFIEHALTVYIDTLTEIRDNLQTPRTGEDFAVAADVALGIRVGPQKE
jgi:prephenate dehydrogenase